MKTTERALLESSRVSTWALDVQASMRDLRLAMRCVSRTRGLELVAWVALRNDPKPGIASPYHADSFLGCIEADRLQLNNDCKTLYLILQWFSRSTRFAHLFK